MPPRPPACARLVLSDGSTSTEIYTLSLHDALPICTATAATTAANADKVAKAAGVKTEGQVTIADAATRSEEHTTELQSRPHLVCRPLLARKKATGPNTPASTNAASLTSPVTSVIAL